MDRLGLITLLHDLRGFRHIVDHAYDLRLSPVRLAEVLENTRMLAERLPGIVADFAAKVDREQGWDGTR